MERKKENKINKIYAAELDLSYKQPNIGVLRTTQTRSQAQFQNGIFTVYIGLYDLYHFGKNIYRDFIGYKRIKTTNLILTYSQQKRTGSP